MLLPSLGPSSFMMDQYLQYNMGILHICHTPHTIYVLEQTTLSSLKVFLSLTAQCQTTFCT